MSLTASARRVGASLRHEVDVNGRHTIVTDEPATLGGTDTGPAPHELLPATLASCISTMIALYAQRKEWDIGELCVDVEYHNDAQPRRFDVTIHLPAELSEEQITRLTRVAETCPVRRALEGTFTFVERVEHHRVPRSGGQHPRWVTCPCAGLGHSDDSLCGLFALSLAVQRVIRLEAARNTHDLLTQRTQLTIDQVVVDAA